MTRQACAKAGQSKPEATSRVFDESVVARPDDDKVSAHDCWRWFVTEPRQSTTVPKTSVRRAFGRGKDMTGRADERKWRVQCGRVYQNARLESKTLTDQNEF